MRLYKAVMVYFTLHHPISQRMSQIPRLISQSVCLSVYCSVLLPSEPPIFNALNVSARSSAHISRIHLIFVVHDEIRHIYS
jgi:hypothetical protein